MSTRNEKITAQRCAHLEFRGPLGRHLIGPVELEALFIADDENRFRGVILACLCDMVLGDDAKDRSDEALMIEVRKLVENQKPKKSK